MRGNKISREKLRVGQSVLKLILVVWHENIIAAWKGELKLSLHGEKNLTAVREWYYRLNEAHYTKHYMEDTSQQFQN
jgi:hypothetical protein